MEKKQKNMTPDKKPGKKVQQLQLGLALMLPLILIL